MAAPADNPKQVSKPNKKFSEMTLPEKLCVIGKVALCIATFGFVYPNILSPD